VGRAAIAVIAAGVGVAIGHGVESWAREGNMGDRCFAAAQTCTAGVATPAALKKHSRRVSGLLDLPLHTIMSRLYPDVGIGGDLSADTVLLTAETPGQAPRASVRGAWPNAAPSFSHQ
jgi:hypothetical protein